MKNIPTQIKLILALVVILFLANMVVTPLTTLYNKSNSFKFALEKVERKQITNWDGYYNIFIDKSKNANINKETFIEVTNIVMSARKDSKNLAWKWNQENQNIPFEEFTYFYKELSSFISERYNDNMEIEQEKQEIVEQHNLMLSTFPNNIYNKVLSITPLEYKQGYVTEETKNRFKNDKR